MTITILYRLSRSAICAPPPVQGGPLSASGRLRVHRRNARFFYQPRMSHRSSVGPAEFVQRRLAAILAGESPVGGDCPVGTVVISGGGEGDRTVESPEVKASKREASNSAGCSESEPVCLEMVDIGRGRAVGTSRRRSALIAKELGIYSDSLPGDIEGDMLGKNGSESSEPLAGCLGAPAQRRHRI
jgi:hypothetical protein